MIRLFACLGLLSNAFFATEGRLQYDSSHLIGAPWIGICLGWVTTIIAIVAVWKLRELDA